MTQSEHLHSCSFSGVFSGQRPLKLVRGRDSSKLMVVGGVWWYNEWQVFVIKVLQLHTLIRCPSWPQPATESTHRSIRRGPQSKGKEAALSDQPCLLSITKMQSPAGQAGPDIHVDASLTCYYPPKHWCGWLLAAVYFKRITCPGKSAKMVWQAFDSREFKVLIWPKNQGIIYLNYVINVYVHAWTTGQLQAPLFCQPCSLFEELSTLSLIIRQSHILWRRLFCVLS